MDRATLERALDICAPGLGATEGSKPLQCYVFFGNRVVTYNSFTMIRVWLDSGLHGGINGKELAKLVKIGSGPIDAAQRDGVVRLKTGSNTVNLPVIAESQYDMHELGALQAMRDPHSMSPADRDPLLDAFADGLQVVEEHGSRPDYLGITIAPSADGGSLHVYATDRLRIVHAVIANVLGLNKHVIVPAAFARLAVKHRNAAKLDLRIENNKATMLADDILVMSKLLDCEAPVDFATVLARHPTDGQVTVPDKMIEALRYAVIIADAGDGRAHPSDLEIAGGKAKLTTMLHDRKHDTGSGIAIAGHDDVTARINAQYLLDASEHYKSFRVGAGATVMSKPNTILLISHYGT